MYWYIIHIVLSWLFSLLGFTRYKGPYTWFNLWTQLYNMATIIAMSFEVYVY